MYLDVTYIHAYMQRSARVLVVEDCTLTQHVIATLLKELTQDITQVQWWT
jgi:CheY-like chemotaxis protein